MAGFNNFDIASMADRDRQRMQQIQDRQKEIGVQTSSMALNAGGSILGLFFPPVGAGLSAASSGVQIGGAASKSVDLSSRSSLIL